MRKQKELDKIAKEIESCKECKIGKNGMPVPGEGNANADTVFIGEAPGRNEALTGRPFVGRSGKFLRENIKAIGLTDSNIFITSPVKYLPDYITPTEKDIEHGKIHLIKQLKVINPKLIILLGSVACRTILEEKIPVSKKHGTVIEKKDKRYVIMYHPAAAIRFQKIRKIFVDDFKKIKSLLP